MRNFAAVLTDKKNTVLKYTLGCFFCILASHHCHVARCCIQSARCRERPHPRIWMRVWRIINTPWCTGKSWSRGSSGLQQYIRLFLSITKKTIIHHFLFSPQFQLISGQLHALFVSQNGLRDKNRCRRSWGHTWDQKRFNYSFLLANVDVLFFAFSQCARE